MFAALFVLSLTALSVWLIRPFLGAAIWGGIIAISVFPLHRRIAEWLSGRRTAAAMCLGLVLAVVLVLPLGMLLVAVGEHASRLVHIAPEVRRIEVPPPPVWLQDTPLIGARLYEAWQHGIDDLPGIIDQIRPKVRDAAIWLLSRTVKSTLVVIEAILAIVFAVIFLAATQGLVDFFIRLLRKLGMDDAAGMLSNIVKTIRGVTQGIIGMALLQAALSWIGFEVAGAPLPMLLTLVTFVSCAVQLGPLIVGIPIVVWLWFQVDAQWAILLLIWLVVVGLVDHLLKPLLIGRGLAVPTWLVFLGVIGGLLAMGLVGLFIGPVILSVSYLLLVRWIDSAEATP